MYILAFKRGDTGKPEPLAVDAFHEVWDVGLALLERGDELKRIACTKDETPVTIDDLHIARANRARIDNGGGKRRKRPSSFFFP